MRIQRSRSFSIRVRGELACFTRPELKVERVSYPIITPSAARGLIEAIVWKPAIQWRIEQIAVLAPIRFIGFRRNEVNEKVSSRVTSWMRGEPAPPYFADDDRAQRMTVALRDVDFAVTASFKLTRRAGDDDNVAKFEEMFQRRLDAGQFHTAPYLGCREFAAVVERYDGSPPPIAHTADLGLVLHEVWRDGRVEPALFQANLVKGTVTVPPLPWERDA